MEEETRSKLVLECECECGQLEFSQFKSDGEAFISYSLPAFYAYQRGILGEIGRRLKLVLSILMGREYLFYEIVISDNKKLQELKKFISEMRDIDEQSDPQCI